MLHLSTLLYWPIIILGYPSLSWVIWIIFSLLLLAITFPFQLNFFYYQIPLHAIIIQAISHLKKNEALSQYNFTTTLQTVTENTNELEIIFEKNIILTQSLNKIIKRYSLLNNLLNTLNNSLNEEQIISLITHKTQSIIQQEGSLLFYINTPDKSDLQLKSIARNTHEEKDVFDQWVLKNKLPLIVTDFQKDFRFQGLTLNTKDPFKSLMIVPMMHENNCIGFIRIHSPQTNSFSTDDLRLFNILSHLTTKAISNARLYQQTLDLAIKDSLTGLYVRKYFCEQFEQAIADSKISKEPFSIAFIDIDHFKTYNDTYGHIAGDKVLIFLAHFLKETLDSSCIISRYGGEEFAILLPYLNKGKAIILIDQLRDQIQNLSITLRQEVTHITISGGISCFPQDAQTLPEIIDLADKGLYLAKKGGRNKICSI
jgi:diguanylate cyclase (GGDEF)-like protein